MQTILEAIEALGGPRTIAQFLGISPKTINKWSERKAFPKARYLAISDLARVKRVKISRDLFRETPDPRKRNGAVTNGAR